MLCVAIRSPFSSARKPTRLGTHNSTSVPSATLLKMRSRAPIRSALSRIPWRPQCPLRCSNRGSIPHPLSRTAMRSSAGPIFDLRLNTIRLGMTERVDNRLPSNAVDFVTKRRPQFALSAFHNHSKSRCGGEAQIARNAGKGMTQRWILLVGGAQSQHGAPAFLEDTVHRLQRPGKLLRPIGGQGVYHRAQLQGNTK